MAKKEVKKEVKKTNKNEKNAKNKKTFFKSFKTELKKVVWPTPKQLLNNTVTVISIVLICAAIVYVLDIAFGALNKQGIDRIRDAVVPQQEETTTNETATNETTDNTTDGTLLQVNEDGTTEVLDNQGESTEATTDDSATESQDTTPTE